MKNADTNMVEGGNELPDHAADASSSSVTRRWTRRRFAKAAIAGAAGACGATAGWAIGIAPHRVETVRLSMPIAGLPDELIGKTLVQISDLHVGPVVESSYLRSCLEVVSKIEPDIMAITGDFVTYDRPGREDEAVALLKDLQPGKLATVAVTGNHDFGAHGGAKSFSNLGIADRLTEKLDSIGVNVLRNSSIDVGGLKLFGVDDFWSPRFDLPRALSGSEVDQPSVMLCHNPDVVDRPGWQNFRGWILSGHTHGGQVRLPFCDAPIVPIRNRKYVSGQVELAGGKTLYVNRGLGYLRRVRLNVRPEITIFELTNRA